MARETVELSWIRHLGEAGSVKSWIRDEEEQIRQIEQTKRLLREQRAALRKMRKDAAAAVARSWSEEEIAQAKREAAQ